jgi:hypothetical protein
VSEQIGGKVLRQLFRALQPALSDVSVDWSPVAGSGKSNQEMGRSLVLDAGARLVQSPLALPPFFGGSRYFVYAPLFYSC